MEEPPSRKRKAHDEGEQTEAGDFDKKQALLTRPPLTAHLSVTSFDGPLPRRIIAPPISPP